MSRICITNCVNDARIPVRANYVNLYKWPESDAEFVKSSVEQGGARPRSTVVDSRSCRQMYLRSYTFSREETAAEKTVKCFGRVKEKVIAVGKMKDKGKKRGRRKRRSMVVLKRVKEFSRTTLCVIFRRLLFCASSVDVVEHGV